MLIVTKGINDLNLCHRAPICRLSDPPPVGGEPQEDAMKVWNTPQVREQEVGLEVTSYLPAEIDII